VQSIDDAAHEGVLTLGSHQQPDTQSLRRCRIGGYAVTVGRGDEE
jgi:hypothetical protein